jgi:hypothetical protein
MRNYDLDPVPSHFVAVFTRDDAAWRQVARIDLDQQPAGAWQAELGGYLLESADAALAVQPELAPACFVRAWARHLVDLEDPRIDTDLAPADQLDG